MTDSTDFSAIRARLRYESVDEFADGYGRYISRGGMFVPMAPQKLKPLGTTIRFQFLLADGRSAFLGEGVVRQIKGLEKEDQAGPVGMLVKFTKLSQDSKELVERIVEQKNAAARPAEEESPTLNQPSTVEESSTGVLAAATADSLLTEALGEPPTAEQEIDPETREILGVDEEVQGEEDEDHTAEAELRQEEVAAAAFAESSGDEVFAPEWREEASPTAPEQEESELGFELDPFFEEEIEAAIKQESEAEEFAAETGERADQPEVGPRAIKETEAGIKVMSFDGSEIDDFATREFEQFTSGGEESEIDEIFDNIFGGGGDAGGFFGGEESAEEVGDDDFFADIDVPAEEEEEELDLGDEASEDFEEAEVLEEPEAFEEAEVVEEPEAFEEAEALEEPEAFEEFEAFDEPEEMEERVSVRETGGDSGENLLSLLTMDNNEEEEMTLNLGGGLGEVSSVASSDEEDDSLESLLANAKKEIESRIEVEDEDEGRDILDDLLGDDDLPPPSAAASPFEVPQPGEKKKKGFMSKLFGKD